MKFIKRLFSRKATQKPTDQISEAVHQQEVLNATHMVLDRYAKTFKDLAKYDRGEKIPNPVSQ